MRGVGRVQRFPDTGGSQGGLPRGCEAAAETCQKKGDGAGTGTEGGPKGYGKAGKKTKTKILFYFLCYNSNFLKGHLEKKRQWF